MADVPPAQAPLGEGLVRGLARLLRKRPMEEDEAINKAQDVETPAEDSTEAGGQGFFKSPSPQDKARRQKQLEDMLKNRR